MDTRDKIIQLGDTLIRDRGYNAFSFSDISKQLNIKNASIHYHFPTKTSLVIAIIQKHVIQLERFKKNVSNSDPLQKITMFLNVYSFGRKEGKRSILGSLSNDYNTFTSEIQTELKILMDNTLHWLSETLKEGKSLEVFIFKEDNRTKALLLITNILGAEQLTRITYKHDFRDIKNAIINNLTNI